MTVQGSWAFVEAAGTTSVDTSGNGRTMTNIPGWTVNGRNGAAQSLNGTQTGGRVTLGPEFDFYGSSTFMCWIKFNSVPAGGQQVIKGPRYGASGEWYVAINGSGRLTAVTGGTGITDTTTLTPGTWYHVAIAFDWASGGGGNNLVLYLNGTSVGTTLGFPLNPGTLYWGGDELKLNGDIDDARWYSEQLSQSQVQALMITPVPSALQASGTRRFKKDAQGNWKPLRTQRIVGAPATLPQYGWQLTKHNSGLNKHGINGDQLPLYTGSIKPASGAVIRGKKITTQLDLSNGNITIDKCYIAPTSAGQGTPMISTYDNNGVKPGDGPVTITDSTIDGSNLSQFIAAMASGIQAYGTITGNYVTGLGSGIAVMNVGNTSDTLIEANYVTGLVAWGDPATDGNHSDAFTIRDHTAAVNPSRQITVRKNRFDAQSGNDTGACFLQTYSGRIDNATIQDNLLEGGGYNFGLNELNATYSNVRVTNNRFNPTGFGPAYVQGGSGPALWTANYINDVNQPNNIGAVVNP